VWFVRYAIEQTDKQTYLLITVNIKTKLLKTLDRTKGLRIIMGTYKTSMNKM